MSIKRKNPYILPLSNWSVRADQQRPVRGARRRTARQRDPNAPGAGCPRQSSDIYALSLVVLPAAYMLLGEQHVERP